MAKELYTAREVAALLDLHVKTVRNYVREGKLKSTRVGKQYRISRADLEAFTGRSLEHAGTPVQRVDVSAVVQIDGAGATFAGRVTNMLMAAAQGHGDGMLQINTLYDEEYARLKVMVLGSIESTKTVLDMVNTFVKE